MEYLLKSIACLTILLLFYKVFLENQSMHTLKRFYLLASLVVSLIIPSIVFIEYIVAPPLDGINEIQPVSLEVVTQTSEEDVPILNFNTLIWSIYFMGLLLFGLKFAKNLIQVTKDIRQNPKQRFKTHIRVLLQQKVPPHTFLKYVFLNRSQLESNGIPHEVLAHEEAHVIQKHSLDVLFVEMLQVFLWFNPILILFKRAIKLNHEFLADQAVLTKHVDASAYQNTLLAFSTAHNGKQYYSTLSNAINYSSIKKRLTVMKTKTSKKSVLIRSLLLLPLLSLLLYGFGDKKTIIRASNPITVISKNHPIKIKINAKQEILVEGKITVLENLPNEINRIIKSYNATNQTKSEVHLEAEGHLNINLLASIKKQLLKTEASLTMIAADSIIVSEKDLNQTFKGTQFIAKDTLHIKSNDGNDVIGTSAPKLQKSATRKQMAEYNKLAKYYNNMTKDKMKVLRKDVERLTYIYNLMSEKQRKDAEPFPNFPKPPSPPKAPKSPKKVSDRQHASNMIDSIINKQDPYDNLNTLNLSAPNPKISSTQNVKKIPPSPKVVSNYPKTSQSQKWPRVPNIAYRTNQKPISQALRKMFDNYLEKRKTYYNGVAMHTESKSGNKKELLKLYDEIITLHKKCKKMAIEEGIYAIPHPELAPMPEDPPPPHLQYTINHVIDLAKKDAVFFYDDKKITNDKAIEILRKNKKLRIKSIFEKQGKTEVRMFSSY